jgi:hypothetical protein
MIIQILLTGLLALLALFVVIQSISSRAVRFAVLAVLAIGAILVWRPEHANAVAHSLGVGRGADLLMYLWVVITLSVILLLYLQIVAVNRTLTQLARRLALLTPMLPPRCAPDDDRRDWGRSEEDPRNREGGGTTARHGPM